MLSLLRYESLDLQNCAESLVMKILDHLNALIYWDKSCKSWSNPIHGRKLPSLKGEPKRSTTKTKTLII